MTLKAKWFDHGREPQCEPDPNFPNGHDFDLRLGQTKGCTIDLPYPAKRGGVYLVTCDQCGYSLAITTAGRPDDPRRLLVPCKLN